MGAGGGEAVLVEVGAVEVGFGGRFGRVITGTHAWSPGVGANDVPRAAGGVRG